MGYLQNRIMRKASIIVILLFILTTVWIIFKTYNKPHRDPLSESSIKISAVELFRHYENNEEEANRLYLDHVLEISGRISEITANQELATIIVLETENPMFAVRCTMEDSTLNVIKGDSVVITGICTGYLSDVIIVKATIIKQN